MSRVQCSREDLTLLRQISEVVPSDFNLGFSLCSGSFSCYFNINYPSQRIDMSLPLFTHHGEPTMKTMGWRVFNPCRNPRDKTTCEHTLKLLMTWYKIRIFNLLSFLGGMEMNPSIISMVKLPSGGVGKVRKFQHRLTLGITITITIKLMSMYLRISSPWVSNGTHMNTITRHVYILGQIVGRFL